MSPEPPEPLTRDSRHLAALLGIYLSLALVTLCVWQKKRSFPVTGDEPYYLVMASGILKHGSLEQTLPYRDEFSTRRIYKGGLAPRDALPSPSNTHAVRGPHGLFSIHNIGLPILLALPFLMGGVLGAKVFLVLLSGLGVVLAWRISGLFTSDPRARFGTTLAVAVGLPLLAGASQVYPDIPAGLIALNGVYWMLTVTRRRPVGLEAFYALTIAFLPWLQVKLAATAALLALGIACCIWARTQDRRKSLAIGAIVLLSFLGLGAFNLYAYGRASGPYSHGALEISRTALMVLLGLQLDQNQGFLLQNPMFFVGVFSIGLLFAADWRVASVWLLVFLSLIVPNALHPSWYGGFSFSGRFHWSAAIVFMVPVILGLTRMALSYRFAFRTLLATGIAFQAFFYARYTFARVDLYKRPSWSWLDGYSIFYRPVQQWLPAMYNVRWAYEHGPNIGFVLLVAGLLVLGGIAATRRNALSGKCVSALCGIGAVVILLGGFLGKSSHGSIVFAASNLPSMTGQTDGRERIAVEGVDKPGFVTFGPYAPLTQGAYQMLIRYASSAPEGRPVGKWDIYRAHRGTTVAEGVLSGTQGQVRSITKRFDVPPRTNSLYEFRNSWNGSGDLRIVDVELQRSHESEPEPPRSP